MTTAENINTFSVVFYYNNPNSAASSFDVSPSTTNLWPNNGTAASSLDAPDNNSNVTITHNRRASINLVDTRVMAPGVIIPANSGYIHILTINFTNQVPSSSGWLTEEDEYPGLTYTNNSFDEFGVDVEGVQFAPLPISIKSFSATKDGDRNARLDWSTSLEINSAYFGIERSTDGKSWESISKVGAAGNSNTEQFYTYTDRDLPLNRSKDQIFYYRLMLVDLDGQYKYSDIRGVNFGKASTDKIISLYPNPAVQMVNLDLSGMDLETGAIYLRVTDMQGRNMIDKTILGNGIEPIEVTQLPAGTYNVAVSQGTTLHQKQFIKID
jgi:hypothetical protein